MKIEKGEKTLLNNFNMGKLSMIESKEKEMEHASEDRKKILAKQIKEAREEIDENNWFITDKNLDKDGNYVKIFEVKNNRIIQNKSSFESTTDKGKLLICFFNSYR